MKHLHFCCEALGIRFWTLKARKDHKWGLHSRIYIHLRKYADTAFGGENLFTFLFVSLIKLDCREIFQLLGFLRNAFYHMDLETSAHRTVCLQLLLILSWNYLEFLPPSSYTVWEAVSSKWIHDHLGILWDCPNQFNFGPGHIKSKKQ